jgi:DNA-binding CsgD family transcriptional regulator
VTDEVTVAIALKMIKDGLPKQQVINYLQITEEEYETLKRKVFDK